MCTISSSSSLSSVLRKKQHRGGVRKPGRIGHVIRHKPLDMETYCSPWASHDLSLPHPSSQCGGFPQGAQGTQTSVHGMPRVPWTVGMNWSCRPYIYGTAVYSPNQPCMPFSLNLHGKHPGQGGRRPESMPQLSRDQASDLGLSFFSCYTGSSDSFYFGFFLVLPGWMIKSQLAGE